MIVMLTLNIMNFLIKYIFLSFHLFFSSSLFFIGEYTLTLILQTVFIIIFFKSKFFIYISYIPIILFGLIKLFASTTYLLYFVNLFVFLYLLYKSDNILTLQELVIFSLYLSGLYFIYLSTSELRYDIYLYFDITDRVNSIHSEIIYMLSFLHLLILFFMGYNKEKLFRIF